MNVWKNIGIVVASIAIAGLLIWLVEWWMSRPSDSFRLTSFEILALGLVLGRWAVDHVMHVAHSVRHPFSKAAHSMTWKDATLPFLALAASAVIYLGFVVLASRLIATH